MKVYISKSKSAIDDMYHDLKSLLENELDPPEGRIMVGAFGGDAYYAEEQVGTAQLVLVVPYDWQGDTPLLSRGVYSEVEYAMDHDIPVYIVKREVGHQFNHETSEVHKHEYVDIFKAYRPSSIYETCGEWDAEYGKAHVDMDKRKSGSVLDITALTLWGLEREKELLYKEYPLTEKEAFSVHRSLLLRRRKRR